MSGTDSVHTAHGIMLQEVLSDDYGEHGDTVPVVPSQPRTKERTLNLSVQQELPGCYVGQRKSPKNPAVNSGQVKIKYDFSKSFRSKPFSKDGNHAESEQFL